MASTQVIHPLSPEQLTKVDFCDQEVNQLPDQVEKRSFFFVTEELFQEILATKYKNAFCCSEYEVEQIKKTLGPIASDLTSKDLQFVKYLKCNW